MDKIKINNQVVKMRKHVKRARLFAINKFTKQLKQLQNKKGNDSQTEKNQRKVNRLLEKIKILKKMMPDFVSKKALSKAQVWTTLLTQKNIPLDDQCLALLANDSAVQKEVEKFHAEECQLVEKIPSLLLEWEMKSKMPKSLEKNKKASNIKRLKLDKIAKRKKSNFKGATFPNNVAVDKQFKAQDKKKKMLLKTSNIEDTDENEENQSKNLEVMEDDSNENDKSNSESFNSLNNDKSGEFFTKFAISNESQNENPESMEEDELNVESADSPSDGESEEFFTRYTKTKKLSKKEINNNTRGAQLTENPPSNVNSSEDSNMVEDSNKNNIKNSFISKMESNKNSATNLKPSIFERLNTFANTSTKNMKSRNSKSNSSSQNTKAIEVLDLNKLQDSEQIPIQSMTIDSQEVATTQTVVPKKDSFFLNGDEEVESGGDDDESNTNNYRDFKPKRRFSNFDRNEKDSKFKRNNFGDKPRKSFNNFNRNESGFQSKNGNDLNRKERRFQNKKGNDLNQREGRFQNVKGQDFNRNENRFQKNMKRDSEFNNMKRFDNKSKGNPRQFKHSNPVKMNDSPNLRRENKKNIMSDSFQSKKQSKEKGEKIINLHPSWEAKNKLKEAAKSGFKGKRIVFG